MFFKKKKRERKHSKYFLLPAQSLNSISVQKIMLSLDQGNINGEQEIYKKNKNKYVY